MYVYIYIYIYIYIYTHIIHMLYIYRIHMYLQTYMLQFELYYDMRLRGEHLVMAQHGAAGLRGFRPRGGGPTDLELLSCLRLARAGWGDNEN